MSLAALLALGFLLGMRHATDADHVVAVSAIVSRERTLRAAACRSTKHSITRPRS